MSDTSQGPGWWQASDGKWYPPEQATPATPTPPPTAPPAYNPTATAPAPGYSAPPAYGAPAGGAPQGQLVEWPQRVLATIVDWVLLVPVMIVAVIFLKIFAPLGFIMYLGVIAASFYFSYLTGETGQSPGKRLIGIKVVSEQTGQPIGGGMGIARSFIHIIDSICLIGYLSPLWDAKKQTFTDKVQSTVVISGPKQDFSAELFKK
ncbi:MAG: domain containing protein [Acidimicrobiales bacterium]|nr:domain containing protein [Acidimicrobiales bacterium]